MEANLISLWLLLIALALFMRVQAKVVRPLRAATVTHKIRQIMTNSGKTIWKERLHERFVYEAPDAQSVSLILGGGLQATVRRLESLTMEVSNCLKVQNYRTSY